MKKYTPTLGVLWIVFLWITGLLPFMPIGYDVIALPLYTPGFVNTMSYEYGYSGLGLINFNIYILFTRLITTTGVFGLFDHLRRRGVALWFWVANNEQDIDTMTLLLPHVDGIMTDNTSFIVPYLSSLGI